jgi:O-antigen/teichoic acid export membrane protein
MITTKISKNQIINNFRSVSFDETVVMTDQQSSYRQIMKATTLFGGVQIFNIIIQIIRSKFVAVLLGPAGMGIMGLLTSTTGTISNLTNFGLRTSAVKDIATAYSTGEKKRIGTVVYAFRRMVWITGLLGLIATLLLSPWLSQLTFGNKDYTLAFIWISATLLFNQLSSGQLVVLQGMRQLNYLAKANLSGSAIGLLVTLPLYYFWGIDGIVPGIIGTSLVSLLLSWYFSGKMKVERIVLSHSQTITEGKYMLRMGFMISLSGLLSGGASYIISIFISRTGGVEQVGLYNAGFAIINTYVGLIFSAMSTDYYPRLSAVSHDNKLSNQTINQQAEIALLILAPIVIIFLIFINWVVILLYSNKFIAVNDMIYWAALGMFFKAASWSIGFVFLAKGASKLFFWNELIGNVCSLSLNLIGYYYWGLTGLGISFAVAYLLYLVQVYFISHTKYAFTFNRFFVKIFVLQFGLAIGGFLLIKYLNQPYTYILGSLLILVSGYYSLMELEKRLGLLSLLRNYRQ